MIRSILALLMSFFLFHCGDPDIREERRPGGRSQGPEGEIRGGRGNLTECKGTDYTLYTYGDCQNFKDIDSDRSSPVDTIGTHPIDVLFVIDSSGSMAPVLTRENMYNKFKFFLSDMKALDWRILFTNASYSKPKGITGIFKRERQNGGALNLQNIEGIMDKKYLDSTVRDYEDVFFDTISREKGDSCRLPPGCSGKNEQPLKALRSSFLLNREFTRRAADFVAVIVTTTDESKMEGATPEELVDSVLMEFESVYGKEKRLFVFSIFIRPEDASCKDLQKSQQGLFRRETKFGVVISELAKVTGGGNFSICLNDFSAISKAIVKMTSE